MKLSQMMSFDWVNKKLIVSNINIQKGRGVFVKEKVFKNEVLFVSRTSGTGKSSNLDEKKKKNKNASSYNVNMSKDKSLDSVSGQQLSHEIIYRCQDDIDFAYRLSYLYDKTSYQDRPAINNLCDLIESGFPTFLYPCLPPRSEFILPAKKNDVISCLENTSVSRLLNIRSMNSFGGRDNEYQDSVTSKTIFDYAGITTLHTAISLLNHSNPNRNVIYLHSPMLKDMNVVIATRDIEVGEELFISYGSGVKLEKWGIVE
mmetsp:Transcript_5203/g.6769  ORF Transcript_5203/g.6769 Transcript_5203/m.6769 type:complete len:259 (+) Transcript_5203:111-887(+)|eukprot:CAMPEP_0114334944 /NCGR_PEP_ID=MMETSP0101-20121206/4723_1 /TAXON_ID=38822 ORGANISM="Pteridomonas danica, Strain PT" /NCGR_SAMPLE_ID=MMETSP0101 /ASSEMBLY_ACC=CAM_ASM_000211 /LENGTH=258 /DNA_ID=CAMNT_0001466393 /DNA_START=1041 /DNA_END=1817 /DNA_ORIENTATION=+